MDSVTPAAIDGGERVRDRTTREFTLPKHNGIENFHARMSGGLRLKVSATTKSETRDGKVLVTEVPTEKGNQYAAPG